MTMATPVHCGAVGGGGSTLTTASFTPAAGSLLLAGVGRRYNSGLPAASTITDTLGLTWHALTFSPAATYDAGSGTRLRLSASWAIATGAAMMVTASQASDPKTRLVVTEFPRALAAISNFIANASATADPSAVMSTPGAASLSFAIGVFAGTDAVSPPTGFTELHESTTAAHQLIVQTAYKLVPTDTATWSSTNSIGIGGIFEIKPAGRSSAVGIWFS